jgi:hypothetical protein
VRRPQSWRSLISHSWLLAHFFREFPRFVFWSNIMPQHPQSASRREMNPTSKVSFAVATCAFAAAGGGLVINQWMAGWMAVGGMAGLGLFYLAVGVLNLGSADPSFRDDHEFTETAAHRLSGITNVDDLPVERARDEASEPHSDHFVNASN